MRATLGTVLGQLAKAHDELVDDPMNDYAGFTPDPSPQLRAIASKLGWEPADIKRELTQRGVTEQWLYFNGYGYVLDTILEIC